MTGQLPSNERFLRARSHLTWGADRALLAHYCHSPSLAETHKEDCIKEIKEAAAALGFELIERVTLAARDGGRMDVEVEADA